jgi:hypothetical protein
MALRLARCFGTTAQLWQNLQTQYDLEIAGKRIGKKVERAIQPLAEGIRANAIIRWWTVRFRHVPLSMPDDSPHVKFFAIALCRREYFVSILLLVAR